MTRVIEAIDWNRIEDQIDVDVWNKLVQNFWVPEKIALSNDVASWDKLTDTEKRITSQVFAGLTLLDTLQSSIGMITIMDDAQTPHEEAVIANMIFMEAVHAKSYSSIFSTLLSSEEIKEVFRWTRENDLLQKKAELITEQYESGDPIKKKIASVFLESFLFYSGFYLPLYWSSKSKLTNTADIIRLILRDEAIHGYYVGYKAQKHMDKLTVEERNEYKDFAYTLLYDLYDNEVLYTQDMYDELGLTEDVKKFLHLNANKALMNLGFDALFSAEDTSVSPAIISSLGGGETHDFFSGSGSTYVIGKNEETTDDDWEF